MINFIYTQLVLIGAHLGTNIKNIVFLATWMIFTLRNKICLLNLKYSFIYLRSALSVLKSVISFKQPIWFVNLDRTKAHYIKYNALLCGEFFCNTFWIQGIISNYFFVFIMFKSFVATPFFMRSFRKTKKLEILSKNFFFTRFTWPRMLFVSSGFYNANPVHEADLSNVPCIVITDANIVTNSILFPVPGNDQSSVVVSFYNNFISQSVLQFKFIHIIFWFTNIRNQNRNITFKQWLTNKMYKPMLKRNIYKNANFSFLIFYGTRLAFFRHGLFGDKTRFSSKISIFIKNIFKNIFKVDYIFKNLFSIYVTKIWLKTAYFGFRRKRLKARFICRGGVRRFSTSFFLKHKIQHYANLIDSQIFIFLTQAIFLNSFLFYFDLFYFKNTKRFTFVITKGLIPAICICMGSFYFKNKPISRSIKLHSTTLFYDNVLNWSITKSKIDQVAPVPVFNNKIFWKFDLEHNLLFLNQNKLKFGFKSILWPILPNLTLFFLSYLAFFKLVRLQLSDYIDNNNEEFTTNLGSWFFVYNNVWWKKINLNSQSRLVKNRNNY